MLRILILLFLTVSTFPLQAAGWQAGLARLSITPEQSLWMGGYAARDRPSEGVLQELYTRALALEDPSGYRTVLVSTDLLGIPASLCQAVAAKVEEKFGLSREQLLLASSHTHAGPVVEANLSIAYDLTEEQLEAVRRYTRFLEQKIVEVVARALRDLSPARLSFGRTEVRFGVNRRVETENGFVIGVNRSGPVDHEVPFLVVDDAEGRLRGVVFSYACHNNTTQAGVYRFHGDYAGTAQLWLEKRYPGSVSLFMMGCGADINPFPRGNAELADEHGEVLAREVDRALTGPLQSISGPLRTAYDLAAIPFDTLPSLEEFRQRLASDNVYLRRHAQEMLKLLDEKGSLPASYPYPVQIWGLGPGVTLVALAGEVVVDYALRLKQELGREGLWVVAYCNDVFGYVPSRRVRAEGGYEAGGAMIYYGQPGPLAPSVEEVIVDKVRELVGKVRGH